MNKIIDIIGGKSFQDLNYTKTSHYESLVLCVIDSIFSIQAKYKRVVIPIIERFCEFVKMPSLNSEFTPKQYLDKFSSFSYDDMAKTVFKNKQRTSSKSGILKSEATFKAIKLLNSFNIQSRVDLFNSPNLDLLKEEWLKIKGQSSGITWRYFLMLAGKNDEFKDDTWIYRFFIDILGYKDIKMNNDYLN